MMTEKPKRTYRYPDPAGCLIFIIFALITGAMILNEALPMDNPLRLGGLCAVGITIVLVLVVSGLRSS